MYDVIIVGTRAAGAPLAMRLANGGLRVLAVDRGSFPSDVVSTHMMSGDSVERLAKWGLLEEVLRSDLPALRRIIMGVDDLAVNLHPEVSPYPVIAPRRSVLDTILVEAARKAGAEVREGFSVQSLICEDGRIAGIVGRDRAGNEAVEHARLVVGADGRNSFVARQVEALKYDERPIRAITYFAYYSGWESTSMETYSRDGDAAYAFPTNWGSPASAVTGPPRSSMKSAPTPKPPSPASSPARPSWPIASRAPTVSNASRARPAPPPTTAGRSAPAGPSWATPPT